MEVQTFLSEEDKAEIYQESKDWFDANDDGAYGLRKNWNVQPPAKEKPAKEARQAALQALSYRRWRFRQRNLSLRTS